MINSKKVLHQASKKLSYNPETGEFKRVGSFCGRGVQGQVVGTKNKDGYLRVKIDYKEYYLHRLAWLFVYGEIPKSQIDHINGNKSDNRICNLRIATNSQNSMNKPISAANTSGHKGVSFNRIAGLWQAYAQKDGKRYSGGYHKTVDAASAAAFELRGRLHGEYQFPQIMGDES